MTRFDRLMIKVIAGLTALLLGLALWGTWDGHDSTLLPGFLYLVAAANDETQVWHLDWDTLDTQFIAQLPGVVAESTVLPGTGRVVYPVARADGGHDLWLLDVARRHARLWVDCTPDDCLAVTPAKDGCGAVYTRVVEGRPALWQLPCDTTAPHPLFETPGTQGHYAAWSPDGTRLAYADARREICIVDLAATADTLCIPALTEAPPVWSPDGTMLLITDMRFEAGFANHILRADVISGELMDLSATFGVEDDAPAWSPDGQWIAFRRKAAGTAMGQQLWLMRADGSDARALTTNTAAHYGPPVWSADGETLLASRHLSGKSEIWTIDVDSRTISRIAGNGYLPHTDPAK